MKKLLILAIAVLAFTACTKENTIQGEWEAYYYCNDGNETQPSFILGFTQTDCTMQSTIDNQNVTGSYAFYNGVLTINWIPEHPIVFNCTIQDDKMTLSSERETIKLRRI